MKQRVILSLLVIISINSYGQTEFIRECKQRSFPNTVPAGNYSGITHIGNNKYAIVSDKSENNGFFVFTIDIDSASGELKNVQCEAFKGDSGQGGDCEGIAYRPSSGTFFISREADATIAEYDSAGNYTGKALDIPQVYKTGKGNYGLESLAYDTLTHLFWTINESTLPCDGVQATSKNGVENILRLQSFGDDLIPKSQYAYKMDAPEARAKSSQYAMGVSEITALGNGRLLVLEREFFVPKVKLGAFVQCKIYEVTPDEKYEIANDASISDSTKFLPKRLVHSFKTKLQLFRRSIANYEGMCIGPKLNDGSTVLILVSDSQNQYAGVLKDWFKTIIIR